MIQKSQIEEFRRDTPACEKYLHLNNAGAALPPKQVLESMYQYLQIEASRGGYQIAEQLSDQINGFYRSIAKLLNTSAENIAFTGNATDAFNRALSAIPFEKGDIILTTNDDYVSNQIAFLSLEKRMGIQIMRAPGLPEGGCDPVAMEQLIRTHRPRLVSVTHIPTNSGLIQNVEAIGKICKETNTWFVVDACQSVGQLVVDVQQINCDFLSASMRKFLRGPRGSGFLYVSDRALQAGLYPLLPDMRGANWIAKDEFELSNSANRFELLEKPFALMIGSATAVEYALNIGLEAIEERVAYLAQLLRNQLSEINGVRVLDRGSRLCGIVTFHPGDFEAAYFKSKVDANGINTSITTKITAQIDFTEKQVDWALRASPHYYNTEEELSRFTDFIRQLVEK